MIAQPTSVPGQPSCQTGPTRPIQAPLALSTTENMPKPRQAQSPAPAIRLDQPRSARDRPADEAGGLAAHEVGPWAHVGEVWRAQDQAAAVSGAGPGARRFIGSASCRFSRHSPGALAPEVRRSSPPAAAADSHRSAVGRAQLAGDAPAERLLAGSMVWMMSLQPRCPMAKSIAAAAASPAKPWPCRSGAIAQATSVPGQPSGHAPRRRGRPIDPSPSRSPRT